MKMLKPSDLQFIVIKLGDFWKFFVTKLLTKVAQNIADFLVYFDKDLFL